MSLSPFDCPLLYVNKTLLTTIIAVEYIEKDAHSMGTRPMDGAVSQIKIRHA